MRNEIMYTRLMGIISQGIASSYMYVGIKDKLGEFGTHKFDSSVGFTNGVHHF